MRRPVLFHLLVGLAILGVLTVGGYAFFVLTRWGQEFDYISFRGHLDVVPQVTKWSERLLALVNWGTLLVASGGLSVVALIRRRYLLGALAFVAIFCAISGTASFKKHLPRPSIGGPTFQEWEGLINESYPSGHTTFATILVLAFILVSAPRFRPWVACGAGLIATIFGFSVIFVGGHRPADPMGAILWSTFCMAAAAALTLRAQGKLEADRPNKAALIVGGSLCLAPAFLTMFGTKSGLAPTFLPLFPMLLVIGATSFICTAWLAWLLSGPDAEASREI